MFVPWHLKCSKIKTPRGSSSFCDSHAWILISACPLSPLQNVFMSNLIRCEVIGIIVRVFANGPGDLGSILGRVIPKTQKKWYLIPPCLTLSIIRCVSRVKWNSPTPRCSSYRKREPSGHPRLRSPTLLTFITDDDTN